MRTFLPEFAEKYGVKKWGASYFDSNQRLFENYVYPYWGETLISKITVKKVDDYYEITAESDKKSYHFDVNYLCPNLAKIANSVENGKKIGKNVQIDIPLLHSCGDPVKNREWGQLAVVDKNANNH